MPNLWAEKSLRICIGLFGGYSEVGRTLFGVMTIVSDQTPFIIHSASI